MSRLIALVTLVVGLLLFAWGLALAVTAGGDEEGVRGMVGWTFLVVGVVTSGLACWALFRPKARDGSGGDRIAR